MSNNRAEPLQQALSRTAVHLLGLAQLQSNNLQQQVMLSTTPNILYNQIRKILKNTSSIVHMIKPIFDQLHAGRVHGVVRRLVMNVGTAGNCLLEGLERREQQDMEAKAKAKHRDQKGKDGGIVQGAGEGSFGWEQECGGTGKLMMKKLRGVSLYNESYRRNMDPQRCENLQSKKKAEQDTEQLTEYNYKEKLFSKLRKQLKQVQQQLYTPAHDEVSSFLTFQRKFLQTFNHLSHAEDIRQMADQLNQTNEGALQFINKMEDMTEQLVKYKMEMEVLLNEAKTQSKQRNKSISEKFDQILEKIIKKKMELYQKATQKLNQYQKIKASLQRVTVSVGVETVEKQFSSLKVYQRYIVDLQNKMKFKDEEKDKHFKLLIEKSDKDKHYLEYEITQLMIKNKNLKEQLELIRKTNQKNEAQLEEIKRNSQKSAKKNQIKSKRNLKSSKNIGDSQPAPNQSKKQFALSSEESSKALRRTQGQKKLTKKLKRSNQLQASHENKTGGVQPLFQAAEDSEVASRITVNQESQKQKKSLVSIIKKSSDVQQHSKFSEQVKKYKTTYTKFHQNHQQSTSQRQNEKQNLSISTVKSIKIRIETQLLQSELPEYYQGGAQAQNRKQSSTRVVMKAKVDDKENIELTEKGSLVVDLKKIKAGKQTNQNKKLNRDEKVEKIANQPKQTKKLLNSESQSKLKQSKGPLESKIPHKILKKPLTKQLPRQQRPTAASYSHSFNKQNHKNDEGKNRQAQINQLGQQQQCSSHYSQNQSDQNEHQGNCEYSEQVSLQKPSCQSNVQVEPEADEESLQQMRYYHAYSIAISNNKVRLLQSKKKALLAESSLKNNRSEKDLSLYREIMKELENQPYSHIDIGQDEQSPRLPIHFQADTINKSVKRIQLTKNRSFSNNNAHKYEQLPDLVVKVRSLMKNMSSYPHNATTQQHKQKIRNMLLKQLRNRSYTKIDKHYDRQEELRSLHISGKNQLHSPNKLKKVMKKKQEMKLIIQRPKRVTQPQQIKLPKLQIKSVV